MSNINHSTHSLEDYRVLINGESMELKAESITHAWEQIKDTKNITAVYIHKQERWINVYTK